MSIPRNSCTKGFAGYAALLPPSQTCGRLGWGAVGLCLQSPRQRETTATWYTACTSELHYSTLHAWTTRICLLLS